jgi:hypothetical protein
MYPTRSFDSKAGAIDRGGEGHVLTASERLSKCVNIEIAVAKVDLSNQDR